MALDNVEWKEHLAEGKGQGWRGKKGSLHMSAVVNLEGFQAADDGMIWVVFIMDGKGQGTSF